MQGFMGLLKALIMFCFVRRASNVYDDGNSFTPYKTTFLRDPPSGVIGNCTSQYSFDFLLIL